jgi:hypothetical protein
MRTFLLLVLAAFVASMIAPFVAYVGSFYMPAGVFYEWFFALPAAAYSLFGGAESIEGAVVMMICIYFAQHLVTFLIAWASVHITRLVQRCISDLQLALPGSARR